MTSTSDSGLSHLLPILLNLFYMNDDAFKPIKVSIPIIIIIVDIRQSPFDF